MFAVVDIAGKQLKVDKGLRVRVPKLDLEEGSKHRFTDVLLVSDDDAVQVGTPHVEGAAVEGTVVAHGRGEKIIVFKKKRRKKYRRCNGHRQDFTELLIDDIITA